MDHLFSRYNIIATDGLKDVARRIEDGTKATPSETKTATESTTGSTPPRLQ
jgi:hypothetical protein